MFPGACEVGGELLLEESWEVRALHGEAAALAAADELWRDVESEVGALQLPHAELDSLLDWSVAALEGGAPDPLVHHDCMWAGKCLDRLHPGNEPPPPPCSPSPSPASSPPPGCSLLRHARYPPRPDTPLSLDEDEPPQFRHSVDVAGTARRLLQPLQPQADSHSVAADHSYTAKPLQLHTPSDSEEEIDVETVGEKSYGCERTVVALPTNPSVSERASLQRTVASAMAPRKRAAHPPFALERSRKRARATPRRRTLDSDSEPDGTDVERRSLHNDMERMRRIGLKNLFDELKAQVPSTRDKARAPKVAILREAAQLCRRLQAEERERDTLRRHQQRLIARVRRLRVALAHANKPRSS